MYFVSLNKLFVCVLSLLLSKSQGTEQLNWQIIRQNNILSGIFTIVNTARVSISLH